jgi:molybdate/tungstate transport system permease protein
VKQTWIRPLLAVCALAALHLGIGLLPSRPLTVPTNIVLFAANLYVLYCARLLLRSVRGASGTTRVGLFGLGYFLLFLLVLVVLDRQALFILLVIVYASLFRVPYLLGYFVLFVLSFVVFQPYAYESFIPLALVYAALWQARRARVAPFLLGCLAVGLVVLVLVLFPLLNLALQDSPRTLGFVLERPDVQRALWTSVASSTIATVIVALWGVPLAYALARVPFAGRTLVETLVDLPILVPQSVVGVALLTLLGPGSPLGQLLGDRLGVQVAGRFGGIVLAQVFVSCPFLIKTAMTAFEGVPAHLESAARTLGASARITFWRVALPLAARGVLVGAILAWSRAVSEFGSIMLFAPTPLTAPVLVHHEFVKVGVSESRPIAVLLLIVCLWIFVMLQFGQALLPAGLRRRQEERL